VIDQQPQIQLGPVQMRGREGLKTLLQRDARDSDRVDRIGLAALTRAPTGRRAQVGRDPQHPLAATARLGTMLEADRAKRADAEAAAVVEDRKIVALMNERRGAEGRPPLTPHQAAGVLARLAANRAGG
jgi:hypothetical protein